MVIYNIEHGLQEIDKFYSTGAEASAGHWEIRRCKRLVEIEGWSNWETCYLALCIEDLPDILALVKSVIQEGKSLNSIIVRTENPRYIYWTELTEYFRMRLTDGAL